MAPEKTLGEGVAERQLEYHHAGATESEALVRIGKTVYDGGAWGCPYEIAGLSWKGLRIGCGEDSVQALLHALTMIAVDLNHEGKSTGGRIAWLDADDSGFSLIK